MHEREEKAMRGAAHGNKLGDVMIHRMAMWDQRQPWDSGCEKTREEGEKGNREQGQEERQEELEVRGDRGRREGRANGSNSETKRGIERGHKWWSREEQESEREQRDSNAGLLH